MPALLAIVAVVVCTALAYLFADKFWISKHLATTAAFAPPPHSIAVLPFVNMSGDEEQEYFSDGLSEELLNDLARINDLQVAARTSAFSFKGTNTDIGTIARKLNVGAVLEGSVRRSAHTVRVTAQLINAVTGFHLWSETYDRDFGDVLKLQSEIATAVAGALRVTLLKDEAARIEVGGTRNPAALDAYLHASKTYWTVSSKRDMQAAIALYAEAIRLDPGYALAYGGRSLAQLSDARNWETDDKSRAAVLGHALADAHKAIALAPNLSEGHLALAGIRAWQFEFAAAREEYDEAFVLAPGSARVLRAYGDFATLMGRGDSGLAMVRRALVLDPLNQNAYVYLGSALYVLRRYPDAIAAYRHAEILRPGCCSSSMGISYYLLGQFENALSFCAKPPNTDDACLAMVYKKLARKSDADAALARLQSTDGGSDAYEYAEIYAQSGDISESLGWLETAFRIRDAGLHELKTDALLDPVRNEPRLQAIERELKLPD